MVDKLKELAGRARTELVTQLNAVATVVLLYIVSQPSAPVDDILGVLPESFHALAKVTLPIVWGIIVQIAIGRLRKRTVEETETKVIDELTGPGLTG